MRTRIVLVDRKGKEAFTLPAIPHPGGSAAWIYYDSRWWGFGVGKLDGSQHFYEAIPESPKMGNPQEATV